MKLTVIQVSQPEKIHTVSAANFSDANPTCSESRLNRADAFSKKPLSQCVNKASISKAVFVLIARIPGVTGGDAGLYFFIQNDTH